MSPRIAWTGRPSGWPGTVTAAATLAACVLASVPRPASAQTADFIATEATLGRVVFGEPFSADGVTRMTQTLADGTRIERTMPSKFFRDSEGRTRLEQTVLGLMTPGSSADAQYIITIVDPATRVTFTLHPDRKTARRAAVARPGSIFFGSYTEYVRQRESAPPPPAGANAAKPQILHGPAAASAQITQGFRLPAPVRRIQGLEATGERTVQIIRTGEIGNDRPIHVTSERWVSLELGLVLESRYDDPRTGIVEFRLTNIQRAEPPRELFAVPSDYKIVDAPPPPSAPPAR